jgi:DNA repair protein RadC
MQLAAELLRRFGNLQGIAKASLQDLQQVRGIGPAKACQLQACAEFSRRMHVDTPAQSIKLTEPIGVWRLVKDKLADYHKEHYILISLDARSRLLGVDILSIGTLDAALVHPRETFAMAIRRHAIRVIVCHNHPSGDTRPSDDDLAVTKRLVTAGKILGIAVVDHVVIAKDRFYSLHEHGQI